MAQPEWRLLLEEAVAAGRGDHWYSWYQLGVLRYAGGDYEGAGDAWTTSLKRRDTAWARRNLAVLAREEGHLADAAAEYEEAVRLRPDLLPLVYECGQCFLEAEEAGPWLKLFDSLPAETRQAGRIRLLEGRAGLAVRDYERVGALLQEQLVIDDLREGERSLSTLWVEYHEQRLADAAGTDVDDAIRERVKSEHPVPAHLDFRMHVEG
jgi:tetratricopeptide (TPR) repeat protein